MLLIALAEVDDGYTFDDHIGAGRSRRRHRPSRWSRMGRRA
ncbi:hypothetical protein [Planosporangium sp. 12N6]